MATPAAGSGLVNRYGAVRLRAVAAFRWERPVVTSIVAAPRMGPGAEAVAAYPEPLGQGGAEWRRPVRRLEHERGSIRPGGLRHSTGADGVAFEPGQPVWRVHRPLARPVAGELGPGLPASDAPEKLERFSWPSGARVGLTWPRGGRRRASRRHSGAEEKAGVAVSLEHGGLASVATMGHGRHVGVGLLSLASLRRPSSRVAGLVAATPAFKAFGTPWRTMLGSVVGMGGDQESRRGERGERPLGAGQMRKGTGQASSATLERGAERTGGGTPGSSGGAAGPWAPRRAAREAKPAGGTQVTEFARSVSGQMSVRQIPGLHKGESQSGPDGIVQTDPWDEMVRRERLELAR